MIMPPAVFSSSSMRRMRTRSCNGRNFTGVLPKSRTSQLPSRPAAREIGARVERDIGVFKLSRIRIDLAGALNIGIADAGKNSPPALDIGELPVFTIWCTAGPLSGKVFEVTDPGRALITGKCADIGKLKGSGTPRVGRAR